MATTHATTTKTLARLLGAALLATPLALGCTGPAHADAGPPAPAPSALLTPLQVTDEHGRGLLGTASAISGTTAVVGARGENAAYVFVQRAGRWIEQARLTARGVAAGALFGQAVAISGNTILVGAPKQTAVTDLGTRARTGLVYEFDRHGTRWTAMGTLGDGLANGWFGFSVALDRNRAVVGAPGHQRFTGAAYVFRQITPGDWQKEQTLVAGDGQPGDNFGLAVAIDGPTIIAGAPTATVGFTSGTDGLLPPQPVAGAAYVFAFTGKPVKSGRTWVQQAKLTAAVPRANDQFGFAVAMSGATALVGAPNRAAFSRGGPVPGSGSVDIYTRTGQSWTEQQADLGPTAPSANDRFGSAIALSGRTALIAAPAQHGGQGAVYVFTPGGSPASYGQSAELVAAGSPLPRQFGTSVALVGTTALIGAWAAEDNVGAAYISTLRPLVTPAPGILPPLAPPQRLTITTAPGSPIWPAPNLPTIVVIDGHTQLVATGQYGDGSTKDLSASVQWVSAQPSGLTVSPSGMATCVIGDQAYTVTATLAGVSGSIQLGCPAG